MQKELDEIFYDALTNDINVTAIVPATRIFSTCIEVPPTENDNTPLPYIIITDDPFQDEQATKDELWESDWDTVQAGIEIAAESPNAVKQLRRTIRHALAQYVKSMSDNERPVLRSFNNEGVTWDWTKPCYYDTLHYQCDMYFPIDDDDEQNEG